MPLIASWLQWRKKGNISLKERETKRERETPSLERGFGWGWTDDRGQQTATDRRAPISTHDTVMFFFFFAFLFRVSETASDPMAHMRHDSVSPTLLVRRMSLFLGCHVAFCIERQKEGKKTPQFHKTLLMHSPC